MTKEELKAYHVEAARKMHNYAEDDRLRPSDVKHYSKRAEFHEECVALIDSLFEPFYKGIHWADEQGTQS